MPPVYDVEFEIIPLRAIYRLDRVKYKNRRELLFRFRLLGQSHRIRKINGVRYMDDGKTLRRVKERD